MHWLLKLSRYVNGMGLLVLLGNLFYLGLLISDFVDLPTVLTIQNIFLVQWIINTIIFTVLCSMNYGLHIFSRKLYNDNIIQNEVIKRAKQFIAIG